MQIYPQSCCYKRFHWYCIYELILKECYHHYPQIQIELENDKADVTVNLRKPSGKHPV